MVSQLHTRLLDAVYFSFLRFTHNDQSKKYFFDGYGEPMFLKMVIIFWVEDSIHFQSFEKMNWTLCCLDMINIHNTDEQNKKKI